MHEVCHAANFGFPDPSKTLKTGILYCSERRYSSARRLWNEHFTLRYIYFGNCRGYCRIRSRIRGRIRMCSPTLRADMESAPTGKGNKWSSEPEPTGKPTIHGCWFVPCAVVCVKYKARIIENMSVENTNMPKNWRQYSQTDRYTNQFFETVRTTSP